MPALTPMSQFEKDLIIELIKAGGMGALAYVFRVIFKIVQNVSSIPKLKDDLDKLYDRVRKLEKPNE